MAGNNLGRKATQNEKDKKREFALKNNIKPPESTWKDRQKAVIMMDNSLNEIKVFKSLSEACRYVGKNHTFVSCITRAIKLNTKSYNYYWKYAK